MFLILSQIPTEFCLNLKRSAERSGLETLHLTSAEIVRDLALAFPMTDEGVNLYLNYDGVSIRSTDIGGVYCEINSFDPSLWERFSSEDACYSAQETQALWLAILASLPCRVVNPPALDTLAGTVLSTPEILYLARRLGFEVPAVVSLESGKVASELLTVGVRGLYADLGDDLNNEAILNKVDHGLLTVNENHVRIREELPVWPVYVTMVGKRFFACMHDDNDIIMRIKASQIPPQIRKRLRSLQKELNVNLMEYHLGISMVGEGDWVFCGCWRPPVFAVEAYGDALIDHVVDFTLGKGGMRGHSGVRNCG